MRQTIGAAIQAGSVLFNTPATLAKLEDLTSDAARRMTGDGARVIVFPEAFVGGYPKGHDFGARVGSRTPEGRDWFRRYYESAIAVPGPETERMGEAARAADASLVVGVIERDGGTLYCTALIFSETGELLGRHRKLMPTAMERLVWGQGDGSTLDVVETAAGKVGALICWEHYMPLARSAMYAQGVEIWAAPTVDDRENWLSAMSMVAREGRCFVVSAVQYLRRRDAPTDYHPAGGDEPDAVLIRGGSCILGPMGDTLAGPAFDEDAILTAELDPIERARGVYDFDVIGHYARPDVFELRVDARPKPGVAFEE